MNNTYQVFQLKNSNIIGIIKEYPSWWERAFNSSVFLQIPKLADGQAVKFSSIICRWWEIEKHNWSTPIACALEESKDFVKEHDKLLRQLWHHEYKLRNFYKLAVSVEPQHSIYQEIDKLKEEYQQIEKLIFLIDELIYGVISPVLREQLETEIHDEVSIVATERTQKLEQIQNLENILEAYKKLL